MTRGTNEPNDDPPPPPPPRTLQYERQLEWPWSLGQTADVHSISAGLDYPGVGPEHAYWKDSKRVEYVCITDDEALEAFQLLAQLEGILPALESSHAIAHVTKLAPKLSKDQIIVINLSGRGDKDCQEVARLIGNK